MPVQDLRAQDLQAEEPQLDLEAVVRRLADAVARLDDRLVEHIVAIARERTRLEARVNSLEHRFGALERKRR
jgi:hypothetical protein